MEETVIGRHQVAGEWHERLGRVGFVAQGVLYGIVGVIAIAVALGDEKSTADQSGALSSLAGQSAGIVLLVILAIGLFAMAIFRLVEVFTGPTGAEDEDEKKEALERIGSLVRAVIYGGLGVTAVRLIADAGGKSSGSERSTTSTVFDLPAGTFLVFAAGLIIIGVAFFQGHRGVTTSFEDDLDQSRMGTGMQSLARALGAAGHIARAVVFLLIGAFLIKAAVEHNAQEAIGLDGALQEIAQQAYGSLLLLIVALGLFVFGAYCLIEARYRRF